MRKIKLIFGIYILALCISNRNCLYAQEGKDSTIHLFYEVNQYKITAAHLPILTKIADHSTWIIVAIKGYTDTVASQAYNEALSLRRAHTIYDWLLHNGLLPSANITIEPFGEQFAGNNPARDRRVDILLKKKIIATPIVKTVSKTASPPVRDTTPKQIQQSTPKQKLIEKLEFTTIYFIPNKAIVQPNSYAAVEDAARALKQYKNAEFEIVGHVNNASLSPNYYAKPSERAFLQKLSEDRARRIYELLQEYGIDSTRLRWRGAGSSQMVFPKPKSMEEMLRNMRVEIYVYE